MGLDDLPGDGQAHTRPGNSLAVFLAPIELLEDPTLFFLRDSRTTIGHADDNRVSFDAGADRER